MQRGRWRHRYKTSVPSQHRTWTTASNQNRRIQPEPLHPTRTAAVPGNEHREWQLRWGTSIIQHWTAAPHPQQLCPHCAAQDGGDLSASSWRDPPRYELALSISKDVELGLKGVEAAPFSSAETAVTAQPYGCFNNAHPPKPRPTAPTCAAALRPPGWIGTGCSSSSSSFHPGTAGSGRPFYPPSPSPGGGGSALTLYSCTIDTKSDEQKKTRQKKNYCCDSGIGGGGFAFIIFRGCFCFFFYGGGATFVFCFVVVVVLVAAASAPPTPPPWP